MGGDIDLIGVEINRYRFLAGEIEALCTEGKFVDLFRRNGVSQDRRKSTLEGISALFSSVLLFVLLVGSQAI